MAAIIIWLYLGTARNFVTLPFISSRKLLDVPWRTLTAPTSVHLRLWDVQTQEFAFMFPLENIKKSIQNCQTSSVLKIIFSRVCFLSLSAFFLLQNFLKSLQFCCFGLVFCFGGFFLVHSTDLTEPSASTSLRPSPLYSKVWPKARSDTHTPAAPEAPLHSQVTARSNVSVPTVFLQR